MKEYNDHIVSSFDDDIASIRRSIIKMATLVEEQYKLLHHIVDTGSASTVEDVLDNEPKLDAFDGKIRDQILKNSPKKNEEFFVVPKVVE